MDFWSNIKQNIQHMNFEECKCWLLCEQENPSDRPSVQQTFHAWKWNWNQKSVCQATHISL
jgi:hypothetical protein